MSILQAIILGIIEGLTEFLPISSTFHLIFGSELLGIADSDFVKMFEVVIQAGAISALLFMYTRLLLTNKHLLKSVVLSFIPTAVVGVILYKIIKDTLFTTDTLMLWIFFLVGIVFIFVERLVKRGALKLSKNLATLSVKDSLLIGLVQSLAVIPGVSRSGSVIVAMMAKGYQRAEAAKYTFLLSIPTIFAASALDLYKSQETLIAMNQGFLVLTIGFLTAFVSAYFVVRWFIKYLETHTLETFAWYRFIVFATLLILLGRP